MSELFGIFLIQLALLKATPLILAALGGLFSERSGISNIALEGMMLGGAFSAIVGSYFTGSALIGILAALMAGGLLGYIFALSCIKWEANQIVSGAAINILAVGLTGFFLFEVFGFHGSSPAVAKMPLLDLPLMDKLPLIGHPLRVMIFQQSPLFGISILLVAFAWLLLYKTPSGLRWRAVGENPVAAETLGVRVRRLRYLAVIGSGLLAALGGAQLSLGDLSQFVEKMTAGRGFIALAALILGRWKPWQVLAACLFFGFADALADSLQSVGFGIPPELFLALPFILTIIVLAGFIGEIRPPAALGKTYKR